MATKIDKQDNFSIIQEELQRYGGPQKPASEYRMVRCPFHGDTDPSMGVYMQVGGKRNLGSFHCLGCDKSGGWNEFAEKTNLRQIKEWKKSDSINEQLVTQDLEDDLLGDTGITLSKMLTKMGCREAQKWPEHLDWRGFPGKLITKIGGHIIADDYNDDVAVLFPIKINGKTKGGVKAIYTRKSKKQLAYLTMRGEWVKKYGLFPFAYTQKLVRRKKYKFVFLVEGPRDALRLISLGIPALAVLGATAMSEVKAMLVTSLGIDTVYIMSDNDNGGDVMARTVKRYLKKTEAVEVTRITLPKKKDKKGNLIKLDPGNMPDDLVEDLVDLLKDEQGFKPKKRRS